jgi:hypothetical protein
MYFMRRVSSSAVKLVRTLGETWQASQQHIDYANSSTNVFTGSDMLAVSEYAYAVVLGQA